MKWKNRLTNYNFWISLVSAALLIVQAFNFKLDIGNINEIATAVLGLLVVIGIISDPTKTYAKTEENKFVQHNKEDYNTAQFNESVKPESGEEKPENICEKSERIDEKLLNLPNEDKVQDNVSDLQNNFQIFVEKLLEILDLKSIFPSVEGKREIKNQNEETVEKNSEVTENDLENLEDLSNVENESLSTLNSEEQNEVKENSICYNIVN